MKMTEIRIKAHGQVVVRTFDSYTNELVGQTLDTWSLCGFKLTGMVQKGKQKVFSMYDPSRKGEFVEIVLD